MSESFSSEIQMRYSAFSVSFRVKFVNSNWQGLSATNDIEGVIHSISAIPGCISDVTHLGTPVIEVFWFGFGPFHL